MARGVTPLIMSIAGTAPTPMKTRNAVPSTSAANRCGVHEASKGNLKTVVRFSIISNEVRRIRGCRLDHKSLWKGVA